MLTITVEKRAEINKIILGNEICFVGLIDNDGLPYVMPMNFGLDGDVIYLHSGSEGGSIDALKKNPNVCITFSGGNNLIYQNAEVACSYRMSGASVICRGKVKFEEDYIEKIKALDIIMRQYTDRKFTYSEPAVNNVLIWKIEMDSVSSKIYGVPHPNSTKHTDSPYY